MYSVVKSVLILWHNSQLAILISVPECTPFIASLILDPLDATFSALGRVVWCFSEEFWNYQYNWKKDSLKSQQTWCKVWLMKIIRNSNEQQLITNCPRYIWAVSRFCGPKSDKNIDFETSPNTINGHTNWKLMVCSLQKFIWHSLAGSPDSTGCWKSSSTASSVLNGGLWSKSQGLGFFFKFICIESKKKIIIYSYTYFYIIKSLGWVGVARQLHPYKELESFLKMFHFINWQYITCGDSHQLAIYYSWWFSKRIVSEIFPKIQCWGYFSFLFAISAAHS